MCSVRPAAFLHLAVFSHANAAHTLSDMLSGPPHFLPAVTVTTETLCQGQQLDYEMGCKEVTGRRQEVRLPRVSSALEV